MGFMFMRRLSNSFRGGRMSEGSHHENIRVGDRIVGHIRVTNSGKILSVWFNEPYAQLFKPVE